MSFLKDKTITGKQKKAYFAIIYGEGGVGKSTLASMAESPYFLNIENGIFHLDVHQSADIIRDPNILRTYMSSLLEESHTYKTVVLDSLSALEKLMEQSVLNKFPKDSAGSRALSLEEYSYGKGYVYLMSVWNGLVGMLKKMNEKGINVILIGHRKIASFEPPSGAGYKYYTLNLFDSDKNSVLRLLTEQADFVGYMTNESPDQKNSEQSSSRRNPTPKKFGKRIVLKNRIINTEATQAFYAKTRYKLESRYPMEEWDWDLLSVQQPTDDEQLNKQKDEQADEDENEDEKK